MLKWPQRDYGINGLDDNQIGYRNKLINSILIDKLYVLIIYQYIPLVDKLYILIIYQYNLLVTRDKSNK